ncbi:MAG: hypothetical protein EOP52_10970 [Sphingobacteriales bacterium]|nr:MAG: hypothetical protein EOP52_10970 [Sphingobacteriales bacterium]
MRLFSVFLLAIACLPLSGCGVYSLSGASISGKTIRIQVFENRARYVSPTLNAALTEKVRSRILSQTGLAPVSTDNADYNLSGVITAYEVTVTGVQNTQIATQNRLTISVAVDFKNRPDPKASFNQTFTRFTDFSATQTLQSVEASLIDNIGAQLADDIFNKAFVNW